MSRVLCNKLKSKKIVQTAGEQTLNSNAKKKNELLSQMVCEDIDNEGDMANTSMDQSKLQRDKRDRLKQMGDPHSIMQE